MWIIIQWTLFKLQCNYGFTCTFTNSTSGGGPWMLELVLYMYMYMYILYMYVFGPFSKLLVPSMFELA